MNLSEKNIHFFLKEVSIAKNYWYLNTAAFNLFSSISVFKKNSLMCDETWRYFYFKNCERESNLYDHRNRKIAIKENVKLEKKYLKIYKNIFFLHHPPSPPPPLHLLQRFFFLSELNRERKLLIIFWVHKLLSLLFAKIANNLISAHSHLQKQQKVIIKHNFTILHPSKNIFFCINLHIEWKATLKNKREYFSTKTSSKSHRIFMIDAYVLSSLRLWCRQRRMEKCVEKNIKMNARNYTKHNVISTIKNMSKTWISTAVGGDDKKSKKFFMYFLIFDDFGV